jgi:hypothetical protein
MWASKRRRAGIAMKGFQAWELPRRFGPCHLRKGREEGREGGKEGAGPGRLALRP